MSVIQYSVYEHNIYVWGLFRVKRRRNGSAKNQVANNGSVTRLPPFIVFIIVYKKEGF